MLAILLVFLATEGRGRRPTLLPSIVVMPISPIGMTTVIEALSLEDSPYQTWRQIARLLPLGLPSDYSFCTIFWLFICSVNVMSGGGSGLAGLGLNFLSIKGLIYARKMANIKIITYNVRCRYSPNKMNKCD